jgi:hypothetical protein
MSTYTATDQTTGHTTAIEIQNRTKNAIGIGITIKTKDGELIAQEWIGIMKSDIFQSMLGAPDAEQAVSE